MTEVNKVKLRISQIGPLTGKGMMPGDRSVASEFNNGVILQGTGIFHVMMRRSGDGSLIRS